MSLRPEEITSIIKERISNFETRLKVDEVGTVLTVGDGVARVIGAKRLLNFINDKPEQYCAVNCRKDQI